jgi:hypothetical protein
VFVRRKLVPVEDELEQGAEIPEEFPGKQKQLAAGEAPKTEPAKAEAPAEKVREILAVSSSASSDAKEGGDDALADEDFMKELSSM